MKTLFSITLGLFIFIVWVWPTFKELLWTLQDFTSCL